jgi:hypothetical protein
MSEARRHEATTVDLQPLDDLLAAAGVALTNASIGARAAKRPDLGDVLNHYAADVFSVAMSILRDRIERERDRHHAELWRRHMAAR